MRIPGFLLPASTARPGLPRFLALTDMKRAPDPFLLLPMLPKNCGLIWRAYEQPLSRSQIQSLSHAAKRSHVPLFLATSDRYHRPAPSLHLHLPEHRLNSRHTDGMFRAEQRVNSQTVITAAAHSERAVIAAARAGVDAVLISPVFPTRSHPGGGVLGIIRFAALAHLARSLGLAVYALGGINDAAKLRRLNTSGATGVAGIDIFLQPDQA